MKYLLIFSFISILAFAASKMTQVSKIDSKLETIENKVLSPNSNWFKSQLGIYIPKDYIKFSLSNFNQDLRKGSKDTLDFEYWLGGSKINSIENTDEFIKIDFSTEGHTRIMFITPNYFIITSYMPGETIKDLTYGSSIVYFPQKNTLKELDTIIVYSVNNNILSCSMEHYNIGETEYKEFGKYDLGENKFIKKNN